MPEIFGNFSVRCGTDLSTYKYLNKNSEWQKDEEIFNSLDSCLLTLSQVPNFDYQYYVEFVNTKNMKTVPARIYARHGVDNSFYDSSE